MATKLEIMQIAAALTIADTARSAGGAGASVPVSPTN